MSAAGGEGPVLAAAGLEKRFGGVRALDGVSFDLRAGEIHALVGENGAGKSTLIRILCGVHPHGSYEGRILLDGRSACFAGVADAKRAGIAVIHQELALVKHMTVGENIFLGDEPGRAGLVDWDDLYARASRLLRQVGLSVDARTEVIHLGVAQQQLVEIAKALRAAGRILILDEPTAALADHEVDTLCAILRDLRSRGTAIIYISHKLDEVLRVADRITVLRDGRTVGSAPAGRWTREEVVRAMVGRQMAELLPKAPRALSTPLLEVEGLSVADPDVPGRLLLQDVSFSVRGGEVLGIAGLMGAGRTELLMTLFGQAPGSWRGAVRVAGRDVRIRTPADAIRAGLALVPEDRKRHALTLIFSVLHNLTMASLERFCRLGVMDARRELASARRMAEVLDIRMPSLQAAVETLSGGNQQKVVLGKWLLREPKVLLLDEPTRGIDVGAKAEIHRLIGQLTGRGLAVVMASSELPEILGAADRVLVLREGRVTGCLPRGEATAERIMAGAT